MFHKRYITPMQLRPRESVILVEDFDSMVLWYQDTLGFTVKKRFDEGFHYCNLENDAGIKFGIALASEMQVSPKDRPQNSVVLQFEVDDVQAFLQHIEGQGGSITGEASYDSNDKFWFGSFADPEGNPFWIVDGNCP